MTNACIGSVYTKCYYGNVPFTLKLMILCELTGKMNRQSIGYIHSKRFSMADVQLIWRNSFLCQFIVQSSQILPSSGRKLTSRAFIVHLPQG